MIDNLFSYFFRVLCFFIFTAFVVRSLRFTVIPYLKSLYVVFKIKLADKIKLRQKMQQQKNKILSEIADQHIQGLNLHEKIKVWSLQEHARLYAHEVELQAARERLRVYMMEQARFLAVTTTQRELLPEIIERVASELKNIYATDDQKKNYSNYIFTTIESNSNE